MGDEETYSVLEAAKVLRVGERRIRQLISAGVMEGVREGRRWRVRRDSVHAFRDSRGHGEELRKERRERAPEDKSGELWAEIRRLEHAIGKVEGRLEITEKAESTLREERERILMDYLSERRERQEAQREASRLRDELEVERSKVGWKVGATVAATLTVLSSFVLVASELLR